MVQIISKEEFSELLAGHTPPCVSLYMPAVRAGPETRQNPIRFKNLLRQAEDELVASGLSEPQARRMVQPAMEMLNDEEFWQRQSDGLALFLSPDFQQTYRLPLEFEEQVFVAGRFHIKPLLPLFSSDGSFYILALSQDEIRLFEASRYRVDELEVEDAPKSLAEALRWDDPEKQLQWNATSGASTGGKRPAPVYHGHGAGTLGENEKTDLLRYFQKVNQGLREFFRDRRIPLVLAGVEYLLPIFRQASDYPYLAEQAILGNPQGKRPEELHEEAWAIVEPYFAQDREKAAEKYRQLAGTQAGRTSADIREIAPAAYAGQVEALFVPRGREAPGSFDPTRAAVDLHDRPQAEDIDLLDFAAAHTFLNGGAVYLTEEDELPGEGEPAATLRY